MILEKETYWNNLVEHFYDNVYFEDNAPSNVYDWLEKEYQIVSDTSSPVLKFTNEKKMSFFVMKYGS